MDTNVSYKQLHEHFVSGFNGTSLSEVALVASIAPASVLLRNVAFIWIFRQEPIKNYGLMFLFDFLLMIVPSALGLTIFSDVTPALLFTLFFIILTTILIAEKSRHFSQDKTDSKFELSSLLSDKMTYRWRYLTNFRSFCNVATSICILAVDFEIFPRRFAKSETYGTGFMDVGVGSFVVANAVVSRHAKSPQSSQFSLQMLKSCFRSNFPLILLGCLRTLSVKLTNYHEHVTEYGVHWNFFFTLAFVKIFSSVIVSCPLSKKIPYWVFSLGIILFYQYLLSYCSLNDFIINGSGKTDSRSNLLEANREGIFSCLGYLSIYFAGLEIGRQIFSSKDTILDDLFLALKFFALSLTFYGFTILSQTYFEDVSRRIANFPYVIWMIGYCLMLISTFLFVELLTDVFQKSGIFLTAKARGKTSKAVENESTLLDALNKNGLLYFIFSNVLTGTVNLSVDTIHTPPSQAYCILLGYLFLLNSLVFLLYIKKLF